MLADIMTKPDLAEACFLIALILFCLGFLIVLKFPTFAWTKLLDYAGFAMLALGLLAL